MTKFTKITSLLILSGLMILIAAPAISYSAVESPDDVIRIINKIAKYMFTAFFVIAIIFIIVAAFNFLTAKADPEKIKSARNQILYAVIAIAIALISTGAVKIIESILN
ncbi:MAG TPA: hypothetical protein ENH26_00665 [Candidatus Wolfebacteria bacterium]|nr:hypothetical protein [Candidatus Wolfebacteria bacterium]